MKALHPDLLLLPHAIFKKNSVIPQSLHHRSFPHNDFSAPGRRSPHSHFVYPGIFGT
jgi:hypothetical protein